MAGFAGLVALGSAIDVTILAKNSSNVPTDADALPTYRIYGPAGFMASGTVAYKDTAAITNCPPANPTVYTSVGHNLTVGTKVTVASIVGNTTANATGNVTAVTSNTFTTALDSSAGGAYVSGGVWHATGVYDFSYTATIGNNFASGTIYSVYCYANFSAVATVVDAFVFQVT